MREQNALAAAGKRAYEARASCRPEVSRDFSSWARQPLYFVQGRTRFLDERRRTEVRASSSTSAFGAAEDKPYGESVGHYEGGDTLVVDTIGLSDDTYVDNYRTPHTTQLHVVERFK